MEPNHPRPEEVEEYHMVVSQEFGSEEEGYEFYNNYAKEKGFSIRHDDKECMPGTEMVI